MQPCQWASSPAYKKLGGDTAKTADPSWPEACSIPYGVVLSNKTGESWPGQLSLLRDWLGIVWLVERNYVVQCLFVFFLFCFPTSLVFLFVLWWCWLVGWALWWCLGFCWFFSLPPSSFFVIKLSLSQPTSSWPFTFFDSLPYPIAVWCIAAYQLKQQQRLRGILILLSTWKPTFY